MGLAFFVSWCACPVLAQSGIHDAAARLAKVNAEAIQRSDAVVREMAQRVTALGLDSLLVPANLATPSGRAGIRRGFGALSRILDEIEAFAIAEEIKLQNSVQQAVSQLESHQAQDLRLGFERGHARMRARYSALYRLQRASIKTTLELVDVVERSPGGVKLTAGRLVFSDPTALASVNDLMSRLSRLEEAEARAEREIVEARRRSSGSAQEFLK
jgi:hypothetical protein